MNNWNAIFIASYKDEEEQQECLDGKRRTAIKTKDFEKCSPKIKFLNPKSGKNYQQLLIFSLQQVIGQLPVLCAQLNHLLTGQKNILAFCRNI
jgi:hypothetical protein